MQISRNYAYQNQEKQVSQLDQSNPLSAYIHIPFCNYKCHFCDFVTAPNKDDQQIEYCQVLVKEIDQRMAAMPGKPPVSSIFYGGGTPGVLAPELLISVHNALLANIELTSGAEITLETTPETVNLEKAKLWHDLGINRLSIGIETFDDQELEALGRKHTVAQAVNAIAMACQSGFENINCDLMYALPIQDLSGWKKSLSQFLQLSAEFPQIKHLSAYALELSPQTFLAKKYPHAGHAKTTEEKFVAQHTYLLESLTDSGFKQYEISNFSKSGFRSTHNLNYWRQGNYLAFGVSAHRYLDFHRSSNWRSLQKYMHDCLGHETIEFIDEQIRVKEAIMLGLRMSEGIDLNEFKAHFGFDLIKKHSQIADRFSKEGLLFLSNERLRLTSAGQLVANSVIAEFF